MHVQLASVLQTTPPIPAVVGCLCRTIHTHAWQAGTHCNSPVVACFDARILSRNLVQSFHLGPYRAYFSCSLLCNHLCRAFRRSRHHCRLCGGIFCASCSSKALLLPPKFQKPEPQRLCDPCAGLLDPLQPFLAGMGPHEHSTPDRVVLLGQTAAGTTDMPSTSVAFHGLQSLLFLCLLSTLSSTASGQCNLIVTKTSVFVPVVCGDKDRQLV